jgi:hypothetical protein
MTHIIRTVYEKDPQAPMLMQGTVIDDDYVEPSTVRVWALWKNWSGELLVGPEVIEGKTKKSMKLSNRVAVHLTKLHREDGINK